LVAVGQTSGAPRRQKVRSRPYADPYSPWTDEMRGGLGSWTDDDEARRLIYNDDSMSDMVSWFTRASRVSCSAVSPHNMAQKL